MSKRKKLLTFLTVAIAAVMTVSTVNAADLAIDQTVEIWEQVSGGICDVSVYPGKASYSGKAGDVTGKFGDGIVLDYRFFMTANDVMESYVDGGAGIVAPVVSPPGENVAGNQDWADVWTATDPGDGFASDPDFTNPTVAQAQNITGTIDVSELRSGTVYVIYGTYVNTLTVTLTMSGAGMEDVVASHTVPHTADNINRMWVSSFDFNVTEGYDTITYTYTNADADGSRARFMGIVIDGITIYEPEIVYPQNGEIVPPGDVTLEWINVEDPCNPGSPVAVDVWFGTDLSTDPNNPGDYTKIVSNQQISSYTITPPGPGVYFWQVNTIAGPNVIEGSVYSFTNDAPIESVNAGPDMVSWSGASVALTPEITDDGGSALTYAWSIGSLPAGITAVFDSPADAANTAVTFTKAPYANANVPDAGFENTVLADGESPWVAPDGWSGNAVGLLNPGNASGGWDAFGGIAPEGENVLFVNAGGSASTVLSETLQEGATYTLSVQVGLNQAYGSGAAYQVQLLAGSGSDAAVIAEDDNGLSIALGTFETSVVTYTYDAVEDANKVGLPLQIRFNCTSGGSTDVEFDNVVLTTDTPFPVADVSSIDVTLTVKDELNPAVSDTLTIDLYNDECTAARVGLGMDIPADVDQNCLVNPEDLLVMAEKWLNDDKNLDQAVPNPATNWPANIFSVSFYRFAGDMNTEERRAKLLLTEDDAAGYGDWMTTGWINIECGWAPDGVDETPDTITTNSGATASFYFHDTRNGNYYNSNIDAMVEGANAEMMEGHGNGTLESAGVFDKIFHIELTDIPFAVYDVIFYLGTQQAQEGDGTGKYSFNDGPYADFARPKGRFDGTFDQVNDGDGTGNFILIEGVTGSSFDFKMHGNGGNHIGLSGFQVRQRDPNAPVVSAGDPWVTWLGEPVTLNATVDGTGSIWNMEGLTYSWTTSADDDPKLDVVVSNPADLNTTVTVTKVPYLQPYATNGSFEIVTTSGGQAVQSYRDYWGQYDRPAGATVSARQYVNNPAYHFPDGVMPDGDIMLRANSSTSESRPDGAALILGDVIYDPTATYELSVAVGHPQETNDPTTNNYTDANWRGYLVQLVVGGQVESIGSGSDNIYGGTVVAEDANSIDIPRREWRTSVVTLAPSPELADLAGQPIQIRLLTPDDPDPAYATQAKCFFDNVVLKINGETGVYVTDPEAPSVNVAITVEEAGTGRTATASTVIDVYDNPCQAAVAADPDFEYDLPDFTEDCITDMADFAELAKDWLLDYALTEPGAKQ